MEKPYISSEDYENLKDGHRAMVPNYLNLLRSYDDKTHEYRKIEFFFYAPSKEKAEGLKKDLEKMNYEVYGIHKSGNNMYSIIGLTLELSLEEDLEKWSDKMNELGYINDCKFDGWGTISL